MDIFGFDNRIIDNILEQKDRQLFYILESGGLLSTQREEITLHNGRKWRIHYWLLKKNTILHYSNTNSWMSTQSKFKDIKKSNDNIYSYLPKDIWASRKT